ncbi:MAG: hypothetical protein GY810_06195 [Aureispira sp.]|nr:hypothetical protein [Aureispira sp.]
MKSLKYLYSIMSILVFSLLLTSANYIPTLEDSRGDNRGDKEQVETVQQKRLAKKKVRLNKRMNKLSSKLDATENVKKQKRLKKKIKNVKKQQNGTLISKLSMIFGIVALSLIVLAFIFFIIGLLAATGGGLLGAVILFAICIWLSLPFSLAAIGLGIAGLVLGDGGKTMAIVGLVLGGIALIVFLLLIIPPLL